MAIGEGEDLPVLRYQLALGENESFKSMDFIVFFLGFFHFIVLQTGQFRHRKRKFFHGTSE